MKFILMMIVSAVSLSSLAGTLMNKATGEQIDFALDKKTRELTILSTSIGLPDKKIKLSQVRRDESYVTLSGANDWVDEYVYDIDGPWAIDRDGVYLITTLVPIFNLPRLGAIGFDLILLPILAPVKFFQNTRYKSDFNILTKAIITDELITISNRRFSRLVNLLN